MGGLQQPGASIRVRTIKGLIGADRTVKYGKPVKYFRFMHGYSWVLNHGNRRAALSVRAKYLFNRVRRQPGMFTPVFTPARFSRSNRAAKFSTNHCATGTNAICRRTLSALPPESGHTATPIGIWLSI